MEVGGRGEGVDWEGTEVVVEGDELPAVLGGVLEAGNVPWYIVHLRGRENIGIIIYFILFIILIFFFFYDSDQFEANFIIFFIPFKIIYIKYIIHLRRRESIDIMLLF